MIQYNNKEFRNIQEQVLKNKEDIEDISSINGLLGIKIVGQIADIADLPSEDSEEFAALEYGDAYIVEDIDSDGEYDFYVKTRPNDEKDYDHWFRLHLQGLVGPKGEQGETGETGPKGSNILSGTSIPNASIGNDGDSYLVTSGVNVGNMYLKVSGSWTLTGNIRGAQGIQGIQGETGAQGLQGIQGLQGPKGDPGGFIKINGVLDSESELPEPETLMDLTIAYLVGENKELYMQIGETSYEAVWQNLGALNVATYVQVNGEYVGLWDADTKLDKVTTTGSNKAYVVLTDGTQSTISITQSAGGSTIPLRKSGGRVATGTPTENVDAVNKQYFEANTTQVIYLV